MSMSSESISDQIPADLTAVSKAIAICTNQLFSINPNTKSNMSLNLCFIQDKTSSVINKLQWVGSSCKASTSHLVFNRDTQLMPKMILITLNIKTNKTILLSHPSKQKLCFPHLNVPRNQVIQPLNMHQLSIRILFASEQNHIFNRSTEDSFAVFHQEK